MRTSRWLLAPLLFLLGGQSQAQVESDALLESLKPQGYVSDYAGVMDANLRRSLEVRLRELEQKTSAQIAVVTLRSLKGGEIRDFANRLFERWGVGRKGKDNGVLILTSLEDRKIWIEVGYGLEGLLPDARVGRILDQAVLPGLPPRAPRGRFGQGRPQGRRGNCTGRGSHSQRGCRPAGGSEEPPSRGRQPALSAFSPVPVPEASPVGVVSATRNGRRVPAGRLWRRLFGRGLRRLRRRALRRRRRGRELVSVRLARISLPRPLFV